MTNDEIKDLLKEVVSSAKQVNLMTGDHAQAIYNEAGAKAANNSRATDEQICRAIAAISGKDKTLKHQQAFLGICCYLASKQKWPSNLETCANKLASLDKNGEWYCTCKWESFRKFSRYGFVFAGYDEWEDMEPNSTERDIFLECRDAARAFDQQLQLEMQF